MGTSNSSHSKLSTNKHLIAFCSDVPFNTGHDFWKDMLNSTKLFLDFEQVNIELAEHACTELLSRLSSNNLQTRNVQTLERILTTLLLSEFNVDSIQRTITGLIVFRFVLKYLLRSKDEQNLKSIILGKDPSIVDFIYSSIAYIANNTTGDSIDVAIEIEAFLLLCITSQRFGIDSQLSQYLCDAIFNDKMSNSSMTNKFVMNILQTFSAQSLSLLYQEEGLLFRARKGFYNTITWQDSTEIPYRLPDACQLSTHFFCLLIHWPTANDNKYRKSLQQLFIAENNGETKSVYCEQNKSMELCQNLCSSLLCNEDGILLLYTIIYNCKYFRSFFLSRANIEEMVNYLLKVIYDVQSSSPHHHSMCLVILLMLSEDLYFSNYLHEAIITIPKWYKDRCITSMTAGNFVYLIILRQLKRNFMKSKDRYLNNNCVGILCNLAHEFKQMHWAVSQKLIDTLKTVFRLYQQSNPKLESQTDFNELNDDPNVTKELILVLIDVMNIILCKNYISNVDLLYSMLYENKFISDLNDCISLLAMDNLYKITTYLCDISDKIQFLSEDVLKATIQAKIKLFPVSTLAPIKEIRFHYTEQSDSSRFFIPYIWALVYDAKYLGPWPSEEFKIIKYSNE
ncbi:hypothetical protein GJ496_009334 [Pomphorhynchus laevis]|nr:hypothetical protein GJ496_009334 [Pomphorhynchus laevis]